MTGERLPGTGEKVKRGRRRGRLKRRFGALAAMWGSLLFGNLIAQLLTHEPIAKALDRSFFQAIALGMVLLVLSRGHLK